MYFWLHMFVFLDDDLFKEDRIGSSDHAQCARNICEICVFSLQGSGEI